MRVFLSPCGHLCLGSTASVPCSALLGPRGFAFLIVSSALHLKEHMLDFMQHVQVFCDQRIFRLPHPTPLLCKRPWARCWRCKAGLEKNQGKKKARKEVPWCPGTRTGTALYDECHTGHHWGGLWGPAVLFTHGIVKNQRRLFMFPVDGDSGVDLLIHPTSIS